MDAEDDDLNRRLVANLKAGIDAEESARQLFARNAPRVHAFFSRRRFSPEDAKDLTQEVFFRVFKSIGTFRGDSRFERWLFQIAAHLFRNELRRRGAGKRDGIEEPLEAVMERDPGGLGGPAGGAPPAPGPLDDLLDRERAAALRDAVRAMPHQMRLCFLLRYDRGFKYREIAELMRISVDTVKAHLHQARRRLKLELADPPDGDEGDPGLGGEEVRHER